LVKKSIGAVIVLMKEAMLMVFMMKRLAHQLLAA